MEKASHCKPSQPAGLIYFFLNPIFLNLIPNPCSLIPALRLCDQDAETHALKGDVGLNGVGVGVDDAQVLVVGGGDVDLAGGFAAGGGDGVGMAEDHVGGTVAALPETPQMVVVT